MSYFSIISLTVITIKGTEHRLVGVLHIDIAFIPLGCYVNNTLEKYQFKLQYTILNSIEVYEESVHYKICSYIGATKCVCRQLNTFPIFFSKCARMTIMPILVSESLLCESEKSHCNKRLPPVSMAWISASSVSVERRVLDLET